VYHGQSPPYSSYGANAGFGFSGPSNNGCSDGGAHRRRVLERLRLRVFMVSSGCSKGGRIIVREVEVGVKWSSQDSVDTSHRPSVSRFELIWAHTIEVAVPT